MRWMVGLLAVAASTAAEGQTRQGAEAPTEVFRFGGEISGNYAPRDPGYFNFIEYNRSGLRLFRVNVAAELRAGRRFGLLTEIRSDNGDAPRPYALYARVRPSLEHAISVDVGLIPPVFGAFARRSYEQDNPLIGYPLAYQYPTVLRADAAPATVAQLEASRGRGARLFYPLGDRTPDSGLPLANPLKWDTGVAVRLGSNDTSTYELAVAVTQGSISNPLVSDDNEGKQLAARLGLRPGFAWKLGISGARGDYVSDAVGAEGAQTTVGADVEWERGYWILRAEAIWSRWDVPTLHIEPLDSLAYTVEARYKLRPGLYAAARFDHVGFSRIEQTWDAPVTRIEAGIGYNLHRQLLLKLALQHNERDGGMITSDTLPAVQLLFWF